MAFIAGFKFYSDKLQCNNLNCLHCLCVLNVFSCAMRNVTFRAKKKGTNVCAGLCESGSLADIYIATVRVGGFVPEF